MARLRLFLLFAVAASCLLWVTSGREIFTKSSRAVETEVVNELFGDSSSETWLVPGPFFGYYVGFDVVTATVVLSLVVLAVMEVKNRIRSGNRIDVGQEHTRCTDSQQQHPVAR
ncbi:MAG: hypothetical protein AABZ47_05140 [Planctomycetota bacterium]